MAELHLRRILTAVALSGAALAATTATALPAQAITVTTDNPAVVTGGAGTPLSSTQVRCTGVSRLQALSGSGNAQVTNDTAVPMGTNGGSGDDVLTGGLEPRHAQRRHRRRHRERPRWVRHLRRHRDPHLVRGGDELTPALRSGDPVGAGG